MATGIEAGQSMSWERTFTHEDVRAFAAVTHDRGRHHEEPDAQGRLRVHGLLTASLPTRLGGDLHYLAKLMTFEFMRPVFTGDTCTCTFTANEVTLEPGRQRLKGSAVVVNQQGKEVLRATFDGVILT